MLAALVVLAPAARAEEGAAAAGPRASFKFAGADGAEVLSVLSEAYGVPFRATAPISQPLTLDSRGQVTFDEAVSLLETAVSSQGLTVRREDGVVKVVPRSGMLAVDIEVIVLKHADPAAVARIVVDLFKTRDMLLDLAASDAAMMEHVLPYLVGSGWTPSEGFAVDATPWPPLNAVIVKAPKPLMPLIRQFVLTQLDEAEGEIKAAAARARAEAERARQEAERKRREEEAARRANEPPPPPEQTRTFQPAFVTADYIARFCSQLKGISPQVLPHNVLMHRTRKYEEFDRIQDVLDMLDIPDSTALQQYYIQLHHAQAEQVRRLLTDLYKFKLTEPVTAVGAERLAAGQEGAAAEADETGEVDVEVGTTANQPESLEVMDVAIPVGEVTIVADVENNALIIRTLPANIKAIRELIAKMDRPRGQVAIDVFIAEIDLTDTTELGVEFLYSGADFAIEQRFDVAGRSSGATYTLGAGNLALFIRALQNSSRLDVISRPSVTTLDNTPATFEFGEQVPLIQASNVSVTGEVISSVIRYQSVATKLKVTPHINAAGFVTLKIEQYIDDVSEETFAISEQLEPRILIKRFVETNVRVYNGQTVFLGGFIADRINNVQSKVPLLGDIPLLGYAFRSSELKRSKSELLIFITPRILRTPDELVEAANARRAVSMTEHGPDRVVPELDMVPADQGLPSEYDIEPATQPADAQPVADDGGA